MARDLFLMRWAKLYSNPTPAEAALEPAIAAMGLPYRFQHPLWGLRIFPDFVLPQQKIVIEVDDPSHNRAKKKAEDAERTKKLERHGWKVCRITNEEALADPVGALAKALKPLLTRDYRKDDDVED